MKTKNSYKAKSWPLCASISGLENVCSFALKEIKCARKEFLVYLEMGGAKNFKILWKLTELLYC